MRSLLSHHDNGNEGMRLQTAARPPFRYVTKCALLGDKMNCVWDQQAHNQGGEAPLENFSPPLEKCFGRSLKILDIVKKMWAPVGKLFAPPGIQSWSRAWGPVV